MLFEWDATKATANLKKHGIAFEDAAYVFADMNRLDICDTRRDYGEERRVVMGMIKHRLHVGIYTMLNRVITA